MVSLICIECRQKFSSLGAALRHVDPAIRVSYNAAGPGKPKQIKTVEVNIPLRKHVVFATGGV